MKDFNKSDIDALDFIVEKCLINGFSITADDLVKSEHIKLIDKQGYGTLSPKFDASKEFVRYLGILGKYDVCECSFSEDAEFARSNQRTFNFQKQGGFKELYKNLKDQRELDKLEFELAESNIEANELNKKLAKRNKRETIINISIGLINTGIFVWQVFKSE